MRKFFILMIACMMTIVSCLPAYSFAEETPAESEVPAIFVFTDIRYNKRKSDDRLAFDCTLPLLEILYQTSQSSQIPFQFIYKDKHMEVKTPDQGTAESVICKIPAQITFEKLSSKDLNKMLELIPADRPLDFYMIRRNPRLAGSCNKNEKKFLTNCETLLNTHPLLKLHIIYTSEEKTDQGYLDEQLLSAHADRVTVHLLKTNTVFGVEQEKILLQQFGVNAMYIQPLTAAVSAEATPAAVPSAEASAVPAAETAVPSPEVSPMPSSDPSAVPETTPEAPVESPLPQPTTDPDADRTRSFTFNYRHEGSALFKLSFTDQTNLPQFITLSSASPESEIIFPIVQNGMSWKFIPELHPGEYTLKLKYADVACETIPTLNIYFSNICPSFSFKRFAGGNELSEQDPWYHEACSLSFISELSFIPQNNIMVQACIKFSSAQENESVIDLVLTPSCENGQYIWTAQVPPLPIGTAGNIHFTASAGAGLLDKPFLEAAIPFEIKNRAPVAVSGQKIFYSDLPGISAGESFISISELIQDPDQEELTFTVQDQNQQNVQYTVLQEGSTIRYTALNGNASTKLTITGTDHHGASVSTELGITQISLLKQIQDWKMLPEPASSLDSLKNRQLGQEDTLLFVLPYDQLSCYFDVQKQYPQLPAPDQLMTITCDSENIQTDFALNDEAERLELKITFPQVMKNDSHDYTFHVRVPGLNEDLALFDQPIHVFAANDAPVFANEKNSVHKRSVWISGLPGDYKSINFSDMFDVIKPSELFEDGETNDTLTYKITIAFSDGLKLSPAESPVSSAEASPKPDAAETVSAAEVSPDSSMSPGTEVSPLSTETAISGKSENISYEFIIKAEDRDDSIDFSFTGIGSAFVTIVANDGEFDSEPIIFSVKLNSRFNLILLIVSITLTLLIILIIVLLILHKKNLSTFAGKKMIINYSHNMQSTKIDLNNSSSVDLSSFKKESISLMQVFVASGQFLPHAEWVHILNDIIIAPATRKNFVLDQSRLKTTLPIMVDNASPADKKIIFHPGQPLAIYITDSEGVVIQLSIH